MRCARLATARFGADGVSNTVKVGMPMVSFGFQAGDEGGGCGLGRVFNGTPALMPCLRQ